MTLECEEKIKKYGTLLHDAEINKVFLEKQLKRVEEKISDLKSTVHYWSKVCEQAKR